MGFPIYRPRRTRATENLRSMIRETELSVNDLIYPLFVVPGKNVKHEIESLPGNYHWSLPAAAPGTWKNLYSRPAA